MPRFDGTGPTGQGPMTGRGAGPCGRGRGLKRGYRGCYGCPWCGAKPGFLSDEDELEALELDKKYLQAELESLETEITELKKSKKE